MKGDVSVKVAAKLTGYSKVSIIRKCQSGVYPNAYQLGGENCQWHIPAEDILKSYPETRRAVVLAKLEQAVELYDLQ